MMRSLLKLMMMGRSFVCRSSSMKMYKATTPRFTSSFRPAYCYLQASPISFVPDYTKLTLQGKYPGAHEETKGEFGLEQPIIKKGDMINLHDLLFTQDRDHLVKYNDDRKVKAAELAGKVIVLYFMPLHHDYSYFSMNTSSLTDTYTYLLPDNVFEVVLVAYGTAKEILSNDVHTCFKKRFEAIFSGMPWTAIPFSDIASRERLVCSFGIDRWRCTSVVIDSTGIVLQSDSCRLFSKYGGLGYPFSDKRIEFLESKDDTNSKTPLLKALLGSPKRDYLISNKGDKVLIDTLKEKVVALYFYEEGITPDWRTTDIMTAYEEFAHNKSCFEVVLIYLYDTRGTINRTSEKSFCNTFETMPWLALPYKDPKCRALRRYFGYPLSPFGLASRPILVIFGPHGEFIEPWGADIFHKFKLRPFPFTREGIVKLHNEKVKELTLEMLWDPNIIFRRRVGGEVRLSQLVGKRIILFFEGNGEEGDEFRKKEVDEFLGLLKHRYHSHRNLRGEFEVIYITNSKTDSDHIVDVSWFVSHASELLPTDLSLYCCYCHLSSAPFVRCLCGEQRRNSSMLAFDRDGRVVRKSIELSVRHEHDDCPYTPDGMKWKAREPEEFSFFNIPDSGELPLKYHGLGFPFYDGSMEMEAFYEISNFYNFLDMDRNHEGLLINSYGKKPFYPIMDEYP